MLNDRRRLVNDPLNRQAGEPHARLGERLQPVCADWRAHLRQDSLHEPKVQ
jgi:hypothetical protein